MGIKRACVQAVAAVAALATTTSVLAAQCGFTRAFTRPDEGGTKTVQVYQAAPVAALGNARPFLFITHFKVNTDGTRISYHKTDITGRACENDPNAGPCAINNISNAFNNHHRPASDFATVRDAGFPKEQTWRVLNPEIIEKDKLTEKPCIDAQGYLVSMTADVAVDGGFTRQGDCDQSKWIDALTVPALVIPRHGKNRTPPSQFLDRGVGKRSIAVAISPSASRRIVGGVVGDLGPANEIGEANVAMNRKLKGLPDSEIPKHRRDAIVRFEGGTAAALVFPGQALVLRRPITAERVRQAGDDALQKFGGADKLYGCIRDEIDPTF